MYFNLIYSYIYIVCIILYLLLENYIHVKKLKTIALIHSVKLDIRKLRYKGHGRYLEKAMHSYANIHVYERNGD